MGSRSSDYRPTRSPSQHESRHSRHSSQASDQDMRSDREATPSPAPTPRRSSRLKRHDAADEEVTPKAKKTRGKGSASVKKAAVETTTPKDMPRRTRRGTMEQATSPDPPPSAPPGPTITETAPSPGEQTSRSSTYQPRAEGDLPRGSSSLRAKTEMTKRAHTGAASYNSSRAGSPSTTGRYSAREEDLPPMEDLEHAKIPLPSFSAISFGHLDTTPTPALDSEATSNSSGTSLLDRIGPSPSQSNQQAVSLAVPSSSRLSGGPLTHRNGGSSTRPRASSPLASGSIVPESELPPISDKPPTAAQTAPQPPLDGFFRLTPSAHANTPATEPGSTLFAGFGDSATVGPKKTLGSGMGKPSASPAPEQKNTTSSDVPDFFGTKSNPTSGTSTPVPPPSPFNFGFGPKPVEGASSFSFGSKPPKATPAVVQTNGLTSDSGGALQPNEKSSPAPVSFLTTTKPAEPVAPATPLFSFGTAKPTEVPKPAFSFGSQSSTPATDKPVEAPEPSFSFGTSSSATPAASKPSRESAKPTDGFGGSASTPPVSKPAEDAPKPTFSFAAPTASTSPTPAAEPAATFGGFNFSKPAEPAKDITARANGTTPSFGFAQANGTSGFGSGKQVNGTGEAAKSNPFAGGGSSSAAPDLANSAFGFGSSQTPRANGTSAPASSFDAPATSTPSTSFGFGSSSPAVASNPFASSSNFQQGAPAIQAPPFSFNANNTPAAPATSNLFASSQSQQPVTSGGFGFNFKANTNQSPSTPQAAPSFGFGQSNPVPSTPSATSSGFGFGTPAATTAQPSFSFGTTTPQATPPSFGFGAPAAAPRFGSPVPGGAPADGGFSLGMGPDAQAPGSPSGRKIKPLRRGAIKR